MGSTATASLCTIGTRTDWTDAASGLSASTLARQFATRTGATCGSYGAATVITGEPRPDGVAQRRLPVLAHRHRQRRQHGRGLPHDPPRSVRHGGQPDQRHGYRRPRRPGRPAPDHLLRPRGPSPATVWRRRRCPSRWVWSPPAVRRPSPPARQSSPARRRVRTPRARPSAEPSRPPPSSSSNLQLDGRGAADRGNRGREAAGSVEQAEIAPALDEEPS